MKIKLIKEEWWPVYQVENDPYPCCEYDISEYEFDRLHILLKQRDSAESEIQKIMGKYDCTN